jgi:hypothetical protein
MHHWIEVKVASSTLASVVAWYVEQVGGVSAHLKKHKRKLSRSTTSDDLGYHLQPPSNVFVSRSRRHAGTIPIRGANPLKLPSLLAGVLFQVFVFFFSMFCFRCLGPKELTNGGSSKFYFFRTLLIANSLPTRRIPRTGSTWFISGAECLR